MDNSKKKKDNDPFFGDGENKPKAPKFNVYWVYILIIAGIIFLQFFYSGKNAVVTSWQEVKNQMLVNKEVQKLVVIRNQGKVEVYLKEDKLEKYKDRLGTGMNSVPKSGPHFTFTIGSIETFDNQLKEAQTEVKEEEKIYPEYVERPNYFAEILTWVLPFALLIGLYVFIFRRMSKGGGPGGAGNIFSVGKSKAQLFDKESNAKIDFKDVAGLEEAKVEVMEIVEFLKNKIIVLA